MGKVFSCGEGRPGRAAGARWASPRPASMSSLSSCRGPVDERSIDQDADTLAEHTFAFNPVRRVGTKSLGSAQRFRGIASETWRENAHGRGVGDRDKNTFTGRGA
jgi:hypothetical protein